MTLITTLALKMANGCLLFGPRPLRRGHGCARQACIHVSSTWLAINMNMNMNAVQSMCGLRERSQQWVGAAYMIWMV